LRTWIQEQKRASRHRKSGTQADEILEDTSGVDDSSVEEDLREELRLVKNALAKAKASNTTHKGQATRTTRRITTLENQLTTAKEEAAQATTETTEQLAVSDSKLSACEEQLSILKAQLAAGKASWTAEVASLKKQLANRPFLDPTPLPAAPAPPYSKRTTDVAGLADLHQLAAVLEENQLRKKLKRELRVEYALSGLKRNFF
jgi:hypothetical protein